MALHPALALCPFCDVIIGRDFVRDRFAATLAFVDEHPALLSVMIHCDRGHQSLTGRCPVTRAFAVDMFAPQTKRAVVAVTAAFERLDGHSAVLADEGFLAGDESHISSRKDPCDRQ